MNMPTHTIAVNVKHITFLVDSGATHTVIKHDEPSKDVWQKYEYNWEIKSHTSWKMSSSQFLHQNPESGSFMYSFLLSVSRLMNLIGRDIMCRLGISFISTPDGINRLVRFPSNHTFVTFALNSCFRESMRDSNDCSKRYSHWGDEGPHTQHRHTLHATTTHTLYSSHIRRQIWHVRETSVQRRLH